MIDIPGEIYSAINDESNLPQHAGKIVFHLVGEQPSPIYLSAIQFPRSCRHILLTTQKTKKDGAFIMEELEHNGFKAENYTFREPNIELNFSKLREEFIRLFESHLKGDEREILLNVTGGTKPMAIVPILMQVGQNERKYSILFFYLDTRVREILWLDNFSRTSLKQKMTIENFIHLRGYTIKNTPKEESQRRELAKHTYPFARFIQRYQEQFANDILRGRNQEFSKEHYPSLCNSICSKNSQEQFRAWDKEMNRVLPRWNMQASFLAGKWFEDYVYDILCTHYPELEIKQNVEISWTGDESAQELDVCYTDGSVFGILECKAGRIEQGHVQKIENLIRNLSGAFGLGGLVILNTNQLDSHMRKRIQESSTICAFCGGGGLKKLENNALSCQKKTIYE